MPEIRKWIAVLLLLAAGLAAAGGIVPARAEPNALPAQIGPAEFKAQLKSWHDALEAAANDLAAKTLGNEEYEALRADLTKLTDQVRAAAAAVQASREATQRMIEALGPAPAEGQPPEAQAVTQERKRLSQALAEINGRIQQTDLLLTRADILLRTAADRRMTQLTEQVFRRGPLPLAPATWGDLPDQIAYVDERVGRAIGIVLADGEWRTRLYGIGSFAVLLLIVVMPVRRLLLRRFGHRTTEGVPSYRQRVLAMAAETVARCLIPVVPTVAVAASLRGFLNGVPDAGPLSSLVLAASAGLSFFFLFTGIARAVLAPDHPDWQLADLEPAAARKLVRRVTASAAGLTIAGVAMALIELMLSPPELRAVVGLGTMLFIAVALVPLLAGRFWAGTRESAPPEEPAPEAQPDPHASEETAPAGPRSLWPRLRFLLGAVALASVIASVAGHHNLSIYVTKLVLATAAVAGVLLVVRGILRELLALVLEEGTGRMAALRDIVLATGQSRNLVGQVMRAAIDGLLLAAGAAAVLPLTGMTWSEMRALVTAFLGGITIGGVTIAPGDILSAILVFVALAALTRFFQRQFDERILGRLTADPGVRNSVRTGVGYLGMTLAALVSVGALGLDLSNLAMIAGALSVGIGFGLQNVVSNFVSGLILLVERPIKVGDWVVVDGTEGLVRRISVRATEIQTFQRASVIIPNSEFVSKAVVNWTHKDRISRVDIRVPVAYRSDARAVYALLLRIAQDNPMVLRKPEPIVAFRDFGPSALEFELRCFIADTDRILAVRTELRLSILDAFRERGIEIPYDQRVLHAPKLEEALTRLADGRGEAEGDGAAVVMLAGAQSGRPGG